MSVSKAKQGSVAGVVGGYAPLNSSLLIPAAYYGFHGCRVRSSGNFSHNSSGSLLAITFNTEDIDTDAYHDTGSNTDRVTIPAGLAGKYLIIGTAEWDTNTSGDRGLQIYLNGTTEIAWNRTNPISAMSAHEVTTIYSLVATDYLQLRVYQNTGDTRTITARAATSPALTVIYLGA